MGESVILALEDIEKRFGTTVTAAGISLNFHRGEFFTLLGPSGSGKSTILRIIAGLEKPDQGHIMLDGRDITSLPPWQRGLGMVFQQYANFPHMNVAENVAYGLRRKTMSTTDKNARIGELLSLVGLDGFQKRSVTKLSGGEQQRVAIARALAPRPQILLLDEPLSALDEKIRREMQEELRRIQKTTGTTFIYVTHDQEEALTMSDRIAVLNRGHCVQCDQPSEIFRKPRTRFVARFFRGCNVVEGTHKISGSHSTVSISGKDLKLENAWPAPKGTIGIGIRGEDIHLNGEVKNCDLVLPATVRAVVYRGLYTDYRLALEDGQEISAMTGRKLELTPGNLVKIGVQRDAIVPLEED
jgi:ABC-type Fe3+/spermidine/putrescine transport system ATPase subunit